MADSHSNSFIIVLSSFRNQGKRGISKPCFGFSKISGGRISEKA